jgi:predicted negative regulator of RcsB-dependent stress response
MAEYLSDEEQIDRLKRLIRQYGSSALTGILLALIAYFGWSYWQKRELANQALLSGKYQEVVDASKNAQADSTDVGAKTRFLASASTLVKDNPDTAYAYQTLLLEARLAADRQDYAAAEKALTSASQIKLDDQGLQQLALIRLARVQLQLGKTDAALATVKTVTLPSFVPTAAELQGDLELIKNDQAAAKKSYQKAWDALIKRQQPRQLLKVKMEGLGMIVTDIKAPNPVREEVVAAAPAPDAMPSAPVVTATAATPTAATPTTATATAPTEAPAPASNEGTP